MSDKKISEIEEEIQETKERQEIWGELKDFPGYKFSSFGRVKGLYGKLFLCKPKSPGYVCIQIINKDGKSKSIGVHILVARVFIPNPKNKPTVDHKNLIKHDNRVENLRWATYGENNANRELPPLEDRNIGKKVIQMDMNGEFLKMWQSRRAAARELGIGFEGITRACNGMAKSYKGYKWKNFVDERINTLEWRDFEVNGVIYPVSSCGKFINVYGEISEGNEYGAGYMQCELAGKQFLVHRLVCLTYKPIDNPELYEVHHKDNNRKNNDVSNLEWLLPKEHAKKTRDANIGKPRGSGARKVNKYDLDWNFLASYNSIKEAVEANPKANKAYIGQVCRGTAYTSGGYRWAYADEY